MWRLSGPHTLLFIGGAFHASLYLCKQTVCARVHTLVQQGRCQVSRLFSILVARSRALTSRLECDLFDECPLGNSIFQTLQNNLTTVNFSLLLIDVMTVADEVDSQLKQTIISFTKQSKLVAA